MRGISETLLIIITAVVLLVAAIVLLTIFGGGVAPVATLTEAANQCLALCKSTCTTTGNMPLTWKTADRNVAGQMKSCEEITRVTDCGGCPR
ncbi:MAG: hypothetical protein QW703_01245 [Candidatus Aenigmatarchaeota archaeon]